MTSRWNFLQNPSCKCAPMLQPSHTPWWSFWQDRQCACVPFLLSECKWRPAGLECKVLAHIRARWGTQIVYPKQLHFKISTKLFLTFYSPFWFSKFRDNIKPLLLYWIQKCRWRHDLQTLNNKTVGHPHVRANKGRRPLKSQGKDWPNKKNSISRQRLGVSEWGEEHSWVRRWQLG